MCWEEHRLKKLQQFGANAWRTAHNPPNEALLNAADRLGVLVWDENHRNGQDEEMEANGVFAQFLAVDHAVPGRHVRDCSVRCPFYPVLRKVTPSAENCTSLATLRLYRSTAGDDQKGSEPSEHCDLVHLQ